MVPFSAASNSTAVLDALRANTVLLPYVIHMVSQVIVPHSNVSAPGVALALWIYLISHQVPTKQRSWVELLPLMTHDTWHALALVYGAHDLYKVSSCFCYIPWNRERENEAGDDRVQPFLVNQP